MPTKCALFIDFSFSLQRRAPSGPRKEEREAGEGASAANRAGKPAESEMVGDGESPQEALRARRQAQGSTSSQLLQFFSDGQQYETS